MGERAKKIWFFVVIGGLSLFLALISEGMVFEQLHFLNETPGMYADQLLFPTGGLETLGRSFFVSITVDSLLWFLFLWLTIRAAERFRQRHSRH